jgi:hypothetical protein
MPNRILKESICSSATVDELGVEEERFFYRLMVQADDYGRMDARPSIIRSRCFPLKVDRITDAMVEAWLSALTAAGLIRRYTVKGQPYLEFVTWADHQQIRAKRSRYPEPTEGDYDPTPSPDIRRKQTQASPSKSPRNPIQSNPTRESESDIESESESEVAPSGAHRPGLALVHPAPKPSKNSRTQSDHAAVVAVLVDVFGEPSRPSFWKLYGKVATELLLSKCDAAEVRWLCQEYQRRWPDVEFTVTALAKHVDTLRRPAPMGRKGRNDSIEQIDRAFSDGVQIA